MLKSQQKKKAAEKKSANKTTKKKRSEEVEWKPGICEEGFVFYIGIQKERKEKGGGSGVQPPCLDRNEGCDKKEDDIRKKKSTMGSAKESASFVSLKMILNCQVVVQK